MMSVCENSIVQTVYFFPAKVSFSNLWTISLDRVITVLSNDGGHFVGPDLGPNC